jgi:hypothetical protein
VAEPGRCVKPIDAIASDASPCFVPVLLPPSGF